MLQRTRISQTHSLKDNTLWEEGTVENVESDMAGTTGVETASSPTKETQATDRNQVESDRHVLQ